MKYKNIKFKKNIIIFLSLMRTLWKEIKYVLRIWTISLTVGNFKLKLKISNYTTYLNKNYIGWEIYY